MCKKISGGTVHDLPADLRKARACWMGCIHCKDKALSPSQRFVLGK